MSFRRRIAAAVCVALVGSAGAVALFSVPAGAASSAAAAGAVGAAKAKAFATLEIIKANVSVRRKGKDVFKPAADGKRLRVGDTVQTDATGFAEVDYTDDSFTRLDVDTTFTIVSLSDDQGNRQIDGSVETGRTWNRTSALTESETFQQEGAGATAAVVGSAYISDCTAANVCVFTSVVDGLKITTVDGEVQFLDPLEACGSTEITDTNADLCAVPEAVSLEVLLADAFIAANYFLDASTGLPLPVLGTPVHVTGIVVVNDDGTVTFTPTFTPPAGNTPPGNEPPGGEPPSCEQPPCGEPPPNEPPETEPFVYPVIHFHRPPVIDPTNPVNIVSLGSDPTPGESTGPNSEVVSQDERKDVTFTLQVTNPDGGTYWIVFTALPDPRFGRILTGSPGTFAPVNLVTQYAPETGYTFDPVQFEGLCLFPHNFADCFTFGLAENQTSPNDPNQSPGIQFYPSTPVNNFDGSVSWTDSFSFKAQNDEGLETDPTEVGLVAVDETCSNESGIEILHLLARPVVCVPPPEEG